MTNKNINGIVTWLKEWFYDKTQIDNVVNPILNRYDGAYIRSSSSQSKPYCRLFHVQSPSTASKSSGFIFEIIDSMGVDYARIYVYLRQNNSTTASSLAIRVLEATNNIDLNEIKIGFRKTYPYTSIDIFRYVNSTKYFRVKVYDDHLRDGTYEQYYPSFSPETEVYESVESAGKIIYEDSSFEYNEIIDGIKYDVTVDSIKTRNGTASQFLKADGSVDSNTYLTSHQDISGKEDVSNKTSSWNSSPNDTRYPTEKLVKDSLDNKSDNNHTHSYLYQYKTIADANSSDLNDNIFKTPDIYAITGNESKTLLNRPLPNSLTYNKNARLEIRHYKNGTIYNYLQIYYVFPNGSENIFYRTWNSSGWNDWIQIAKISDIPTKISDLTNDSNFIETSNTTGLIKNDGSIDTTSYSTFSGSYVDLSNKPSIPSKISDLTNDSDFIEISNTVGLVKNDGSIDTTSYSTFSGSYNDLSNKPTIPVQNVWYGTSTTGASTQTKVVTTSSNYTLDTGTILKVKFTNAQTFNASSSNPLQLKVNDGENVDVVFRGIEYATRYHWVAGELVTFVYDGTNYVMENEGIATTTYYGVTKLSDSITSTSSSLSATSKAVKTAYDLATTYSTYTTEYSPTSLEYDKRIVQFSKHGDWVLVEYSIQGASSQSIPSGTKYDTADLRNRYSICEIPTECIPSSNKYQDVRVINDVATDVRLIFSREEENDVVRGRMRINSTVTANKMLLFYGSFMYNVNTISYISNNEPQ